MFAVVGDHPDVVQLLLSSGAQVDLQNEVGYNTIPNLCAMSTKPGIILGAPSPRTTLGREVKG